MVDLRNRRPYWILFNRFRWMRSLKGFWAHWNTYASPDCQFSDYDRLYKGTELGHISVGRFTYFSGAQAHFASIGSFCSIGHQAIVGGLGRHPLGYLSTSPVFYSTRRQLGISFAERDSVEENPTTTLGHDVWVGARALIMDGINVGNGAVIGAGAIVTKDVPPYAIVGGIPAKIIRMRHADDVISALEEWHWWDLPLDVIRVLSPYFASECSVEIIASAEQRANTLLAERVGSDD